VRQRTSNASHQDGEIWCVDFARVNKLLPRRLRQLLDAEQPEAFTVDMFEWYRTLNEFDRLGRSPLLVFLEPPTIYPRGRLSMPLFSSMPTPSAGLD
jgi:hypothetical protein